MNDYTPKTYEIRYAWQEYAFKDDGSHQDEFDRWLAAHDAEVRDRMAEHAAERTNELSTHLAAATRELAEARAGVVAEVPEPSAESVPCPECGQPRPFGLDFMCVDCNGVRYVSENDWYAHHGCGFEEEWKYQREAREAITEHRASCEWRTEPQGGVVVEEPEWEYGYRPTYGETHPSKAGQRMNAIWDTRRTPDNWRPEMGEVYRRTAEKVIPAGPWVPVEQEGAGDEGDS